MTDPHALPVAHPPDNFRSSLPTIVIALICFSLALLVRPHNLEHFVSLQWNIGPLQTAASRLSDLLAALGVLSILAHRLINNGFRRLFPTARHFFDSLALMAASILVTLGMIELALWKLDLPFNVESIASETALAQFDPEIGWSYVPNHSAVQQFGAARREVPMYFDEIGARVGKPETHHNPTAPSVILVGCSLTMGHGLPWNETVAGQLEATPDFPLQVVNLGVQAYGTDQSLLLLRRHMKRFNAKVVLYTFVDDHVVRNNKEDRRLLFPHAKFIGTKPLFGLAADGSLFVEKPPHRFEDVWESHVWSYARLLWTEYGPVPDLELTRALVREMRRFVEANGATFLLVRWPGSRLPFQDPDLREMDLNSLVPREWGDWKIAGDDHPDARADAFVAKILARELTDAIGADVAKVASRPRGADSRTLRAPSSLRH
jgi:hypothetical protein